MAAVTIVSYIMYTLSPEVILKHSNKNLYMTSFWVIIGLLRYLQITLVQEKSGSPTGILIKDVFIQVVLLLWFIHIIGMIYGFSL